MRLETLLEIVDLWASTALTLSDCDLRLMQHLARTQARKAGGAVEGAVEEIQRIELATAWGELRTGVDRRAERSNDRRVRSCALRPVRPRVGGQRKRPIAR